MDDSWTDKDYIAAVIGAFAGAVAIGGLFAIGALLITIAASDYDLPRF